MTGGRPTGDPQWHGIPLGLRPSCWRKIGYATRKPAKQHAKYLREAHDGDPTITEYLCPTCMRWHVGHATAAPQRRIARQG